MFPEYIQGNHTVYQLCARSSDQYKGQKFLYSRLRYPVLFGQKIRLHATNSIYERAYVVQKKIAELEKFRHIRLSQFLNQSLSEFSFLSVGGWSIGLSIWLDCRRTPERPVRLPAGRRRTCHVKQPPRIWRMRYYSFSCGFCGFSLLHS